VRPVLLLVLVASLAACSSLRRGGGNPNDVTVCVANNTVMGTLRVWSDVHGRTHNVSSGDRQCRRVGSGGGEVRLYAETIGGGIEGPARGVAVVPNRPGECWLWDFRGFNDNGNLVPCDFDRSGESRAP
jgi:hypothetical protein